MKINDASVLGLPGDEHLKIQKIINENRINYECWIEPCKNIHDLIIKLASRGVKNIPNTNSMFLEEMQGIEITKFSYTQKSMIRRKF